MFGGIKTWLQKRREAKEVVALIMLLDSPRLLTVSSVEQTLIGAGILSPSDSPVFREEQTSFLRGTVDGFELTVASLPTPYKGLSAPKPGMEVRLADGMSRHTGFLTIDCWKAPDGAVRQDARAVMAKIAAALTDESTLAFYDWTATRLCLPDPEILDLLREGKLDEAVDNIGEGVVNVDHDEKSTKTAIEEARRRWPEFVEAFPSQGEDPFLAKLSFTDGKYIEHMWIEVTACDSASVTGVVANKPFRLARPRRGDTVTRPVGDLTDWVMIRDGAPIGGFLEQLIHKDR